MAARVLVLDFDGTVCLGDDPVIAYAREVAALMPRGGNAVRAALDGFLAGAPGEDAPDAEDGYQTVARVALRHGLDADALGRAYRASRESLLRGDERIHAPEGLRALLDELRDDVHIALVTNAPAEGIEVLLDRLGLGDAMHEVIGDAGKPERMGEIVDGLLERHGLAGEPASLLSVGDIWVNDLEAPFERGCMTALIDRFQFGHGTPHARARDFPTLYPAVRAWARNATVTVA